MVLGTLLVGAVLTLGAVPAGGSVRTGLATVLVRRRRPARAGRTRPS